MRHSLQGGNHEHNRRHCLVWAKRPLHCSNFSNSCPSFRRCLPTCRAPETTFTLLKRCPKLACSCHRFPASCNDFYRRSCWLLVWNVAVMKLQNKDGSLTRYGLSCNYIEYFYSNLDRSIKLSLEGNYKVTVFDHSLACKTVSRRVHWWNFDSITVARRMWRRQCRLHKKLAKQ